SGDTLAAGASGNSHGVLYTKLSAQAGTLPRFALASYQHALAHYRPRVDSGELEGALCGVLQLSDGEEWQRLRDAFADHDEWVQFLDAGAASARAGVDIERPALWLPNAGWLSPAALCHRNADHPLIDIRLNCHVQALQHDDSGWQLQTSEGALDADAVVIANAWQCQLLAPLPVKTIRRHVTYLPSTL